MEAASAAFLEWAAAYDTAGLEQRSRVAHEAWLTSQTAPALRLDASAPVDDLVAAILGRLAADAGRRQVDGVEGYVEHADTLAARFESVAFADVHRVVLPLLPDPPRDVIDVGAGTGRDAAALAAMGHRVVAVEPVAALRAHGRRLHPSPAIAWLDDSLPDLRATLALGRSFDVVLVSAVWMHLDAGQRRRAMPRVAALLRPGAIAIVSLRHGPVPAGRRMFAVSADETCALAHAHGLETLHRSERDSAYGPSDVRWSVLAFRRGA
ncbi:MAG: methyltransferase domain-containing protein [Rhodospirillales bacterium]|nr:MAG: methyltransferase domain-containing protein [Rhodospirillales bacterium]